MAKIRLKTTSQTKSFIKRMNKFYQKLDSCEQHGTTRYYTGYNDVSRKVYHYRKHRVKIIGNCVWLCVAENNNNPNCMVMWDYYEPKERLAWLGYAPKHYHRERSYQGGGSYWETIRN